MFNKKSLLVFLPVILTLPTVYLLTSCSKQSNYAKNRFFNVEEKINWDWIKSYQKNVLDCLAANVYTYEIQINWCDPDEAYPYVKQQCGWLNKQLEPYKDDTNTDAVYMEQCYNQTKALATQCGIDPVDWWNVENIAVPQLQTSYYNDLITKGVSPTDATNATNSFISTLNTSIIPKAKKGFYDNFEFSMAIASDAVALGKKNKLSVLKNDSETNWTISDLNADKDNTKLAVALNYAQTLLNDRIVVNNIPNSQNDMKAFVNKIKIYTSEQKQSGSLDIGSTIDNTDLQKVLLFKYNKMYGIDKDLPSCDYSKSTSDDFNSDIKFFTDYELFDGYDAFATTYSANEFYPGYTLHAKIMDIDSDNSQKVNLKLQFGTSPSSKPETILWSTVSTDSIPSTSSTPRVADDKNKGIMSLKIDLLQNDQKVNCSKNVYYTDPKYVTLYDKDLPSANSSDRVGPDGAKNQCQGIESNFYDTANNRPNIEKVLSKIPANEAPAVGYDFSDAFFDIGSDEIKMIPVPNISGVDNSKKLHGNQTIKFKFTGSDLSNNTNTPYSLSGHWVIADTDVDNPAKFIVVKDLQWQEKTPGASLADDIWIQYNVNQDLINKLNYYRTVTGWFDDFSSAYQGLKNVSSTQLDKMKEELDNAYQWCVVETVLFAVSVALSATYIALSVWTFGADVPMIVLSLLVIAATAAIIAFEWMHYEGLKEAYNVAVNIVSVVTNFTSTYEKVQTVVNTQKAVLNNPSSTIEALNTACFNIYKVLTDNNNANANTFSTFLITISNLKLKENGNTELTQTEQNTIKQAFLPPLTTSNGDGEGTAWASPVSTSHFELLAAQWTIDSYEFATIVDNGINEEPSYNKYTKFMENNNIAKWGTLGTKTLESIHETIEIIHLVKALRTAKLAGTVADTAGSAAVPYALITLSVVSIFEAAAEIIIGFLK